MNLKKSKPDEVSGSKNALVLNVTNKNILVANVKIILGVIALFASAQIEIPIKPVPVTLQTVVLSIIALSFSPVLSFTTVLTYITLGAAGVPMFIKYGSGINHLSGMTGGYLVGFLIAAPTISWLKQQHRSNKFLSVMSYCLVGHAIIYILGISWLATYIGLERAVFSGFLIYIPSGMVKIFILSSIYSYINPHQK